MTLSYDHPIPANQIAVGPSAHTPGGLPMASSPGLLLQLEEKDKMDCPATHTVTQRSVEPGAMLREQECHQSMASKESVVSGDTSFRGSLGTVDVRRPSSATSYSVGSISGNNASSSPIGALATGETIGFVASGTGGGVATKSLHGGQDTRDIPSLRIAEDNQISTDGRSGIPTSSQVPGELVHPGMEIFNYDTGRHPHDRHLTPPLQLPNYSGPEAVASFNPTHTFLVTRTGTPGLSQNTGSRQKHHLLKSRGWEIREVPGAIRQGPNGSTNLQRAGTGGLGEKNAAAELALENVTEMVFGVWGCWANTGFHIPWRRLPDSTMLPTTPSATSTFLSHIRTSVLQTPAPRSPSLAPSSIDMRPSLDSRAGRLPGSLHLPPDPAYVSLKTNPASSKSTFYSIETGTLISGDFRYPKARGSHAETYQSETGRIPISQWKVPYNINSPSTITLLNYDSQHNQQHKHKPKPQKSKKVEVWAEESDPRAQSFAMDKSTYTWEFRVRRKMKVPISTGLPSFYSFSATPATQSPRIPYPLSPATPASAPSTPTGMHLSNLGGGSSLERGVQKVVKYRSECLVLVKEVDGARCIVAEYYFPKSMKSTALTPLSTASRLRRFMSSATPSSSTPIKETSPNQPPPTPSTLNSLSPSLKGNGRVHYTNIGGHQSGILLLDARGVNKVIALNSLLLTLKREKQRKIATLNVSGNSAWARRWRYGVYDNDLFDEGDSKAKGKGKGVVGEHHKRGDNSHDPFGTGGSLDSQRHDITISVSPDGHGVEEGETLRKERDRTPEFDVEEYSLQGDDWEYDETEGWKRRGPSMVGSSRGGVG